MAKAVKATRAYHSPRRRAQAEATRRSILDAAELRFEHAGYAATTIDEIADAAGVSPKTVYLSFATKSGVLRALWDLRLKGDQDDAPVADRPWYREVLDEPDPERQLRLNARNARVVKERIGALLRVIRDAAPADADTATLWALIQSDFHANQQVLVESLDAKGALRSGLGVERATDILWTLNHPDVWLLLVVGRSWSADEFERWLADACVAQLLEPTASTGRRSTPAS
jgi:AcrR family transcriptional regulator